MAAASPPIATSNVDPQGVAEIHRRLWPYRLAGVVAVQFLLFTATAMALYPGGTNVDHGSVGYSFLHNVFSDLGLTVAHDGASNLPSAFLFSTALVSIGAALILVMLTLPQLFAHRQDLRRLSLAGSAFGVVTGLAFIGIAFTPANRHLGWHMTFVQTAFRAFLGVALLYGTATWRHATYPRRYAVGWVAFTVLIGGYVWLLVGGPSAHTPRGLLIQASGQKLIVYASILCIWWQCRGALQVATGELRAGALRQAA